MRDLPRCAQAGFVLTRGLPKDDVKRLLDEAAELDDRALELVEQVMPDELAELRNSAPMKSTQSQGHDPTGLLREGMRRIVRERRKLAAPPRTLNAVQALLADADARRWRVAHAYEYVSAAEARKASRGALPYDELVGAGLEGLLRATMRFDTSRDLKFLTYAKHWVRQSIWKANEFGEDVRAPQANQARIGLRNLPSGISAEDAANVLGVSVDIVRHVRRGRAVRLDATFVSDEAGETLLERMVGEADGGFDLAEQRADVERALGTADLDEREREVIFRYFGLDGTEPGTLSSIGKELGRSGETVRQIKRKALAKIRNALKARPTSTPSPSKEKPMPARAELDLEVAATEAVVTALVAGPQTLEQVAAILFMEVPRAAELLADARAAGRVEREDGEDGRWTLTDREKSVSTPYRVRSVLEQPRRASVIATLLELNHADVEGWLVALEAVGAVKRGRNGWTVDGESNLPERKPTRLPSVDERLAAAAGDEPLTAAELGRRAKTNRKTARRRCGVLERRGLLKKVGHNKFIRVVASPAAPAGAGQHVVSTATEPSSPAVAPPQHNPPAEAPPPSKVERPKPFGVEDVRVRASRGPKDGLWYWRARRYRNNAYEPVWTGWGTRDEAEAAVRRAVQAEHDEADDDVDCDGDTVPDTAAHLEDLDADEVVDTDAVAFPVSPKTTRDGRNTAPIEASGGDDNDCDDTDTDGDENAKSPRSSGPDTGVDIYHEEAPEVVVENGPDPAPTPTTAQNPAPQDRSRAPVVLALETDTDTDDNDCDDNDPVPIGVGVAPPIALAFDTDVDGDGDTLAVEPSVDWRARARTLVQWATDMPRMHRRMALLLADELVELADREAA